MRKTFIIGAVLCAFGLMTACNNQRADDGADKATQENEIIYNDKIQDTFFGVPFGSTGQEVIDGFRKAGLVIDMSSSTASTLFFESSGYDSKFSFGGMSWDYLRAGFSGDGTKEDGRFYTIQFCSSHKSKESAIKSFNYVLNTVKEKYVMYENPVSDTTTYERYVGQTMDNHFIMVVCYSYESFSHDRWIGVELIYGDNNYKKVSDEL